jgi:hypothetical protein
MVVESPLNVQPTKPRTPSPFLTQLADAAKRHGHSESGADPIAGWCRQYIVFHRMQHPQEMGRAEIAAFLDQIARVEKDPLGATEEARRALEFVYATYLQREIGELPLPRLPRLLEQVK